VIGWEHIEVNQGNHSDYRGYRQQNAENVR
jgi:hypothetical protein